MLEPQRSQYLRALGIDVYVPRLILPAAKPSRACEWNSAALDIANLEITNESPTSSISAVPIAAPIASAPPARSMPPLQARENTAKNRSAGDDAKTADVKSPEAKSAPKFALSVVADSGILIVDDAPTSSAVRADYLRLLTNIVFALQGKTAQLSHDVFLWPMVKNPQLDQSEIGAREALNAYLNKHIEQRALHTVLLLGAAAQRWAVIDAAVNTTATVRCYQSVSALACLRTPQYKRQLWNDLRHLAVER